MKTNLAGHRLPDLVVGVLCSLVPVGAVLADTFTVDTNQSSIALSGTILILGSPSALTPQGSGSLTATYGGTIQMVQGGSTIQFNGGSLIEGRNSGIWEPKSDGTPGSEPANYGGQVYALGQTAKVAVRNLLLDTTSPVISVTSGQFDSRSLVFGFSTNGNGILAYSAGFFGSGAKPLTGYATNNVTTLATIVTAGSLETLTIPVDATFRFTLLSLDDSTLNVKGQVVAVRSSVAPLTLQSLGVMNQTATLQWQSAAGQFFKVLSSPDLRTWQTNAVDVSSGTTNYTWSGPATAPKMFYRIVK